MTDKILKNNFQNKTLNFIKKNLKKLIIVFMLLVILLFTYFLYQNLQKRNEIKLSQNYTQASIQFKQKKINKSKLLLESIIDKGHKFYSPLALYFIIDNNLETDPLKIINFFDKIINIGSIDNENLNLIKIKKLFFYLAQETKN